MSLSEYCLLSVSLSVLQTPTHTERCGLQQSDLLLTKVRLHTAEVWQVMVIGRPLRQALFIVYIFLLGAGKLIKTSLTCF